MPAFALDKTTFNNMIGVFIKAVDGDSSALEQSVETLTDLLQKYPHDPLVKVYFGSIYTIQGRDAWMPWNKLSYTEKGMDIMDDAIKQLYPDDEKITDYLSHSVALEVKFVAATTFVQVPDLFGRFDQGLELMHEISEHPQYTLFNPKQRAIFELTMAQALFTDNQKDDAKKWLSNAVETGLDKTQQIKAKELLTLINQ